MGGLAIASIRTATNVRIQTSLIMSDIFGGRLFDEKQCTCGLGALRGLLWDHRLSETYCKKEIKRIEGFGATLHHTSNVDSLKAEVDTLRSEIVETRDECEQLKAENAKLVRKLGAVKNAATV